MPAVLQGRLELVDVLGRGELVVVAEESEERAVQLGRAVDEGGHLEREALGRRADDEGAVTVDRRIDGQADAQ